VALAAAFATNTINARAGEQLLRLESAELQPRADGYALSGRYVLHLTPLLEDALHKGIGFAFIQAFEAERPRGYWFPEPIAVVRRNLLLSYNALLRQYQLQIGSAYGTYDSLTDALRALCDINDWLVLGHGLIEKNETYQVRVRMYFDPSRLSKPLQLNAFASERWDMDSGWYAWSFKP
jgi:hypothetical protein